MKKRFEINLPKEIKRYCPNKCGLVMELTTVDGVALDCLPPIYPADFVCPKCDHRLGMNLSYSDGSYSLYLGEVEA